MKESLIQLAIAATLMSDFSRNTNDYSGGVRKSQLRRKDWFKRKKRLSIQKKSRKINRAIK